MIDVAAPRASLWDRWNASGSPRYPHEKVVQFTFRNFPPELRRASAALDVGCGSGVHTRFLAAEGFDVTGIDVSSLGVENTRRRLSAAGLTATLEIQDVAALELPAERFQLAICMGVLDCAGRHAARAAVPQILRSLTPGGRGLFVFASDRDFRVLGENPYGLHGFTRAEVEELFAMDVRELFIDRYISTYRGGEIEQNDWLVTVMR